MWHRSRSAMGGGKDMVRAGCQRLDNGLGSAGCTPSLGQPPALGTVEKMEGGSGVTPPWRMVTPSLPPTGHEMMLSHLCLAKQLPCLGQARFARPTGAAARQAPGNPAAEGQLGELHGQERRHLQRPLEATNRTCSAVYPSHLLPLTVSERCLPFYSRSLHSCLIEETFILPLLGSHPTPASGGGEEGEKTQNSLLTKSLT